MKIIILANSDISSNYALNLLLPKLQRHNLRVYLSAQVGSQNPKSEQLTQLSFFEQTLFTEILFPLLDTQQNATDTTLKSFQQLEYFLEQSIQTITTINSDNLINEFNSYNPDVIISIRFGLILHKQIIATAKYGVINLHSGKLPEYQGVMASFHAMLRGDREIGTSLHFIQDSSIDTGNIIASTTLALQPQHSYLWHVLKLYEEGTDSILDAVKQLETNTHLSASPQQGIANYYSFPNQQQLKSFLELGWKLFDVDEIQILISKFTKADKQ